VVHRLWELADSKTTGIFGVEFLGSQQERNDQLTPVFEAYLERVRMVPGRQPAKF
jgi:hypothetical protein